jgi:hypothetical protein
MSDSPYTNVITALALLCLAIVCCGVVEAAPSFLSSFDISATPFRLAAIPLIGAPAASTIRQFCRDHGISIPTYYVLKKRGLGPAEMRMARIIRISAEAAAAWRHARENPGKAEAAETSKISETLRDRAVNAAAKAVASPLHISRRERA